MMMTEAPPKIHELLEGGAPTTKRIPQDQGHFGIRIDTDGVWWRDGLPFTRPALVKLFATVLKRDDAGDFWLETPVERGRIDVEDSPFTAVELAEAGGTIQFRTNLDEWIELDAAHPLRIAIDAETEEPRPYIIVRDNLEARLLRSVFYELVELAEEDPATGALVLRSAGAKFVLIKGDAAA